MSLAPTVMSLSSSIYNAMELKNYKGEASEKDSSAFLLDWKCGRGKNKSAERYPSLISFSPGEQNHREHQN